MSECESVRGEWGEPCPDCGQRLPTALPWEYGRPCDRPSRAPMGSGGMGEVDVREVRPARSTAGVGIRIIPRTPVGGWRTDP